MSLDHHEQAVLQRDLPSLDSRPESTSQDDVEAAWREELSRRVSDIKDGTVELLDFDQSHQQIRAQLTTRRK